MSMVACKACSREFNADVLKSCPACHTPIGANEPPPQVSERPPMSLAAPSRTTGISRALSAHWTDLQRDASRVATIFSVIAWLVLIVGLIAGVAALLAGASESLWTGLVAAAVVAAYTAAGWAFLMLGAVAARFAALTATERADI